MKREYKLSKGWTIASWVFIPLIMAGGSWFLIRALGYANYSQSKTIVYLILGSALVLFAIYGILDLLKSKIIIENNSITSIGVFRTKTLQFHEIDGVELNENYLLFIPKEKNKSTISFSKYYQDFYHVTGWAFSEFTDLAQKENDKELDEIAHDETFGSTQKERIEKSIKLKKYLKPLNIFTWIAALSLFLFVKSYNLQVTICALIPLAGIGIYLYNKGLVKLVTNDDSPYPSISTPVFISTGILMIRALKDEEIMDYSNFWVLFAALVIVFCYLLLYYEFKSFKKSKVDFFIIAITVLLTSAAYSYSVIVLYNDILDKSEPTVFKTTITDKHISKGKSNTYYLTPAPWGDQVKADETSVSRKQYESTEIGDTVLIKKYSGKFKLPYYYIK